MTRWPQVNTLDLMVESIPDNVAPAAVSARLTVSPVGW